MRAPLVLQIAWVSAENFGYGMYPSKSTTYVNKATTKQVKSISDVKIVQLGLEKPARSSPPDVSNTAPAFCKHVTEVGLLLRLAIF